MRLPLLLLLLLPPAAALLACGPTDPSLEAACSARQPGTVIVGTGDGSFEPVTSAGVKINEGPQGGQHIWIGLRCQNLGPKVTASIGVVDVASNELISQSDLKESLDLEYDSASKSDQAGGIYGYLTRYPVTNGSGGAAPMGSGTPMNDAGAPPPLPEDLTGRKVVLRADVTDGCNKPAVHGEMLTTIAGYQ